MKEYIKNKYKKSQQFSVIGFGSDRRDRARRIQANADRLGGAFARLTPPYASNLKQSNAEMTSLDLISDGPIEGFFNSKGESCNILEATYYDDTVIAQPGVTKLTFENLTVDKIIGVSTDFEDFVSGKLNEYNEELDYRFTHRNGIWEERRLEAFGNYLFESNSPYRTSPYIENGQETFRGGIIEDKIGIEAVLNAQTDYFRDIYMGWNVGRKYPIAGIDGVGNTTLDIGKGVPSEAYNRRANGHRKSPYILRKIYHPEDVANPGTYQRQPPTSFYYQQNNPMLYQGAVVFGASITNEGAIDASFCTRAFYDALHIHPRIDGYQNANPETAFYVSEWLNYCVGAMRFGGSWPGPDGPPSRYVYSFAPGSDLGVGLKEPIIDSVSEKINSLGFDYYKPYKLYSDVDQYRIFRYEAKNPWGGSFSDGRIDIENSTIGGKQCVKFTSIGSNANTVIETVFRENRRAEFFNGKTYQYTGQFYISSTNQEVNRFRLKSISPNVIATFDTNTYAADQWHGFTGYFTKTSIDERLFIGMERTTTSSLTSASNGDFIGIKDLCFKEFVGGQQYESPRDNFAYMKFSADDFFGNDTFVDDFELSFSLNSGLLNLKDSSALSYSFGEVAGFDLKTKRLRESLAFEFQAGIISNRDRWLPFLITGAAREYDYGVELKEAQPNKFKGAFLYPVYLGDDLIPLQSNGVVDTGVIFITETDSAQVSGNKLQSGIDNDYDVFSTKSGKIREEDIVTGQQLILNSGISGTRYAGYYNDNVNFSRATVQAQYYTNSIQQGDFGSSYTTEFVGFFRARHNGAYGFRVASDDASHLWVGNDATGGFTTSNATINNGGLHSNQSRSATINLESGKVYAFRAMQGEDGGGANFNVYFTPPGGSETSNFAGYFYTYSGSNKIDPEVLSIQNDRGFYNFTNDVSGSANLLGKQDVSGEVISYAHVANPKISQPDELVTGEPIGLRVRERASTLFNYEKVDLDYVVGSENQPCLNTEQIKEYEINKNLYGPSNPNSALDKSIYQAGSEEGFTEATALTNDDYNTSGTTSRDVEPDGTDQSNWMNNIVLDSDEYFVSHIVQRREIDSIIVSFLIQALLQTIAQGEDPFGVSAKGEASKINFSIEFSFEGVPESTFPTQKNIKSYYGTVANPYGVDTEKYTLPTYDDIIDFYPNETKASLAEKYKRKVVIRKIDFETTSARIRKEASVYSIKEIISEKFSYPYSAIVKNTIDARNFASPPRRNYNVRLKRIKIPSNYFPLDSLQKDKRFVENKSDLGTRKIYVGDWDGSFKIGWTDNPAWILYDLITNSRYGLGSRLDDFEDVNIFNLYKIARYCDAVDENGIFVGVDDGFGGLEPRYSCNILLDSQQNAFETMQDIASVFNGMAYWANGTINFFSDEPQKVSAFFGNANVYDGIFNYQDTSTASHFNIADVAYLDKNDNYNQKVETVENEDGIREEGPKRIKLTAKGATSRGQARRMGRYALYTNKLEREIINFKASSESIMLSIGSIIEVKDELRDFEFNTAKALEIGSDFIVIENTINDQSILTNHTGAFVNVPTGQQTLEELYDITRTGGLITNTELENMEIKQAQELKITGVQDLNNGIKLKLEDTFGYLSSVPTGSFVNVDLQHRRKNQYRVMSITPEENNLYEIVATEHNSGKFNFIENQDIFTVEEETGYNIGIIENTIKTLSEPEGFSTSVVTKGFEDRINFSISGNITGNEEAYEVTTLYPNGRIDKKIIAKQESIDNGFIKTTGSISKIDTYGTFTFEVRSIEK